MMACHRCKERIRPGEDWRYKARVEDDTVVNERSWHNECYRDHWEKVASFCESMLIKIDGPEMPQRGIR